jgi:hypothetical protein
MSNYEYENYGEQDWEDRESLIWREYDWQQYLKQMDRGVGRFLSFYLKFKAHPNRIDKAAAAVGWVTKEGYLPESEMESQETTEEETQQAVDPNDPFPPYVNMDPEVEAILNDSSTNSDLEPYTIHQHPVFVITRGLFTYLRKCWELYLKEDPTVINAYEAWNLSNSFNEAEHEATMAIAAVDLADYNLAVCHFKNAHAALNMAFSRLQVLGDSERITLIEAFKRESRTVLFDIRDVWLRVMRECREGSQRLEEND